MISGATSSARSPHAEEAWVGLRPFGPREASAATSPHPDTAPAAPLACLVELVYITHMHRSLLARLGSVGFSALAAFAIGCEEPPLPTPAGAVFVDLRDSGADCNLLTHQAEVGLIGNSGTPELVSTGSDDASVSCSVVAAGGGFNVTAKIDQAPFVEITVNGLSKDNNAIDKAVEGVVSYASVDTGGDIFSSNACLFWLNSDDQEVSAGAVWLTFACPTISSEGNVCELAESHLAVENCTGAAAEEEE